MFKLKFYINPDNITLILFVRMVTFRMSSRNRFFKNISLLCTFQEKYMHFHFEYNLCMLIQILMTTFLLKGHTNISIIV